MQSKMEPDRCQICGSNANARQAITDNLTNIETKIAYQQRSQCITMRRVMTLYHERDIFLNVIMSKIGTPG